jgi:GNAT superfamily N-acetyltransferase
MARRTYLEMRSPDALRPSHEPGEIVTMTLESPCGPGLYRQLYLGVGAEYRWTDRAAWTDEEIAGHVGRSEIDVWTARVGDDLAGFFELRRVPEDGSVELAYFGLLPRFTGRGLGGHLLTTAVRTAWALDPSRVWVHTCTLDHPAALPNYLRRGFVITHVEEYEVGG